MICIKANNLPRSNIKLLRTCTEKKDFFNARVVCCLFGMGGSHFTKNAFDLINLSWGCIWLYRDEKYIVIIHDVFNFLCESCLGLESLDMYYIVKKSYWLMPAFSL